MIKDLPINGLDLAVGIVLLISALLAFVRGFVHEMLSIAAWAGALAAATYGLPYARPFAHRLIPYGWAADAAAAVLIFLAVLLALSIISHAIARTIQKSALNNLDRSLGFIFGLVRAVVVLGVGLMVVDWLTERERPVWVRTAKTLPLIEMAANEIKALVPPSFMAPADAAKDALHKAEAKPTRQSVFDRLTKPAAAADGKSGDTAKSRETGYENRDRQNIEQLIQRNEAADPEPAPGSPGGEAPKEPPR